MTCLLYFWDLIFILKHKQMLMLGLLCAYIYTKIHAPQWPRCEQWLDKKWRVNNNAKCVCTINENQQNQYIDIPIKSSHGPYSYIKQEKLHAFPPDIYYPLDATRTFTYKMCWLANASIILSKWQLVMAPKPKWHLWQVVTITQKFIIMTLANSVGNVWTMYTMYIDTKICYYFGSPTMYYCECYVVKMGQFKGK